MVRCAHFADSSNAFAPLYAGSSRRAHVVVLSLLLDEKVNERVHRHRLERLLVCDRLDDLLDVRRLKVRLDVGLELYLKAARER